MLAINSKAEFLTLKGCQVHWFASQLSYTDKLQKCMLQSKYLTARRNRITSDTKVCNLFF